MLDTITPTTYTEDEARALLDKTFESTIDFFRVPQGTRGKVVDVERGRDGWKVLIEWQIAKPEDFAGEIAGGTLTRVRVHQPQLDWFTRLEMEQCMREINDDGVTRQ